MQINEIRRGAIEIAKLNDSGVVDVTHVFFSAAILDATLLANEVDKLAKLKVLVEAAGRPKLVTTPKISLPAERLLDQLAEVDADGYRRILDAYLSSLEKELQESAKKRRKSKPDTKDESDDHDDFDDFEGSSEVQIPAKRSIDEVLVDLEALVGLASVKQKVKELINMQKLNLVRAKKSLPPLGSGLNLVLTGDPGTGKTSVARILSEIYRSLGLLDKGHLIEAARQDMVGVYLGQTAPKTAQLVKSAIGGVLFIDEAYSLTPKDAGDGRDYGHEAVAALIQLMENHRHEVAIFVAGYTAEMANFLDSNPGLRSRFSTTIEFESYSPKEMVEITSRILEAQQFTVDSKFKDALEDHYVSSDYSGSNGNGRYARNLVDQMLANMANRLGPESIIETRLLTNLDARDVPKAKGGEPVRKVKLGFQPE